MHQPKVELSGRLPLFRSSAKPQECLPNVSRHTVTAEISHPEARLCDGIACFCRGLVLRNANRVTHAL
jgi:hypothetical protein